MGRSIDELLEDARTPDVRDTAWYRCVQEIRDLRDGGAHVWADEILLRMAATIERTQRVTDAQLRTVEEIRESERAPSRNYDAYGFGRRWR